MRIVLDLSESEAEQLLHIVGHPVETNYYSCECSECLQSEVLLAKVRKAVALTQAQQIATH